MNTTMKVQAVRAEDVGRIENVEKCGLMLGVPAGAGTPWMDLDGDDWAILLRLLTMPVGDSGKSAAEASPKLATVAKFAGRARQWCLRNGR